jgi:hypothetical protein
VKSSASRTARLNRQFPARWIDVATDAATAHAFAGAVLTRRHYRADAPPAGGALFYEYGTRLGEFIDDMYSLGLIAYLRGRPRGYGKVAVWTEAIDGGTRVTVSLVTSHYHATSVHAVINELIDSVAAAGVLLRVSVPFSGIDLPADSLGQPAPGYRRRQERKQGRARDARTAPSA